MPSKKPLLALLILLFSLSIAYGQTVMWVHTNDGLSRQYRIDDIKKLTFELDTVMTVEDLEKLESIAKCFKLSCNYPNPFNSSTSINYKVNQPGMVEICIYDVIGREVATLVSERKEPGNYQEVWNGMTSAKQKAAAGVYFYRLTLDGVSDTKKMLLIK